MLAPVALILVLIAVYVVVSGSLGIDDESGQRDQAAITETDAKEGGEGDGAENPKTYVVEEGDVLSSIAEKFDVSTDRLLRLNPDLDPQTVNVGVVIKIR